MSSAQFTWDASAVSIGLSEIGQLRSLLLARLKYLLDEFHGVQRSIEFYDLVAGIWLESLTQNIYCAWSEVQAGDVSTIDSRIPVISTLTQAQTMTGDVGWHSHLRWAVSNLLQGSPAEKWAVEQEPASVSSGSGNRLARQIIGGISTANPRVLLTQPGFRCSRREWIGTLWRWRNWIKRDDMQYPITISSHVDWTWRKRQSQELSLPPRDFQEVVIALMPLYLPITLLEGFEDYRNAVLALPVSRPDAVFSAAALHTNLTFKLLLAEWRQEGTRLLYHQHGGGYGLESQLAFEEHETRLADQFYSWGWRREGTTVSPLSPAMPEVSRSRSGSRILLTCLDLPRAPYRLAYTPIVGAVGDMHRNTYDFLRGTLDRRDLTIRPYPVDFGWGASDSMRAAAPEAAFAPHARQYSLYASSRLVVHNYLGTSWLETLGLNIPTVCFYDPAVYVYRSETHAKMARLIDVGILQHSGTEAARFITAIGKDIDGWWNSSEVQEARRNFVASYANFSPRWAMQWEREFHRVLCRNP